MSSSRNENALPEGEGEEGHKLGYSLEIDTKYDVDEEFRKPGYARGPEVRAGTRYDDLPEGGYIGGSVGRARAVTKKGFSAQADGPCGFAGSGSNREFKILRLRTTATDKHATAHDQNHVTVHFSRVVLRLR